MIEIGVDRAALLAEAVERVQRRRDWAAAAARMGPAADELAGCLQAAVACVAELARPAAALLTLDADDPVHPAASANASRHGRCTTRAYLLSCGYDSRVALARLGDDYMSYHLQDAIAREIVFALGREVARRQLAMQPELRFVRRAVCSGTDADRRPGEGATVAARATSRWDPAQVVLLLQRFGGALGVVSTASGALAPLHSLLGLMVGAPAAVQQPVQRTLSAGAGASINPASPA